MPQPIDPQLKSLFLANVFRPAITTWNRLEGRPRKADFDRSLRVEIRDPLWMLCRQWQLGEFQGEDSGSAIGAKVQITTARINRYAGPSGEAVGYHERLPLEARVERESIPLDLTIRSQIGRHWFRLIDPLGNYRLLYLSNESNYRFAPPADSEAAVQLRSDRYAWQLFTAFQGRLVDGGKLLQAIRSGAHETWLTGVIDSAAERQPILDAAQQLKTWFERVYSQPTALDDSAWLDSYLEYQFACAAPADETGETQTVLVAQQYHHGHLDWYSFDLDTSLNAQLLSKPEAIIPEARLRVEEPISFIPNPIEFSGMPNVRWWEFEDRLTNLGDLRASTSELATLILAEFGLIYGNDWSLVPYEVEVGTLCEVQGVVVTDVFGIRTFIRPAADTIGRERERWGLYHLSTPQADRIDTRLFLPPVTPKLLESRPLEQVILTRDEIANMVWGIEQTIPGIIGNGSNGYEAATNLEAYLLAQAPPSTSTTRLDTEAAIRYRLGTRVPENWIPFIPIHNPGSNREIRLQRAALPRLISGAPRTIVEPRGKILRPGLDEEPPQPYFINEEEVQKAGEIVTRTYQRTRWWDGRIYTWLGRRKRIGRGQGSSGLEFDRILPIEQDQF